VNLSRRHLILAVSAAAFGTAQAARYEGQTFADSLALGGSPLVLNGTGKRQVAWLKGYLAALYLTRRANTPDEAYRTPGPKRIEMRILIEASTMELVKAVDKGMGRNCTEPEKLAVAERQKQFTTVIASVGKVRKGDLITIDYLPERGTVLTINGKVWGSTIPGADFYTAFMKVFLGEKPSDTKLRAGLLGQAVD
jgi:hypothetical protein